MGNVYNGHEDGQEFEDTLREYLLSDDSEETSEALEAGAEWAAAGGVVDEVVDPKKEKEALERLKKSASKGKGLGLAGKMSYLILIAVSGSILYQVVTDQAEESDKKQVNVSHVSHITGQDARQYDRMAGTANSEPTYLAQASSTEMNSHRQGEQKGITTTGGLPEESIGSPESSLRIDAEEIESAAIQSSETAVDNAERESLKYESQGRTTGQEVSGTKVVYNPGAYYDPNEVEQVSDKVFESENSEKNIAPSVRRITYEGDWSTLEGTYVSSEHNLTYKLKSKQGLLYGKGRGLEEFVVVTVERDGITHILDQKYAEPLRVYFVRNAKGDVVGFKYEDVYINTLFKKVK